MVGVLLLRTMVSAILFRMRFVCPYCKAETTVLHENRRTFSKGTCKSCGKKFLIMPLAVPMEMMDSWKCARRESFDDSLIVGFIALGIVVLATGLIIGICCFLT